MDLCRSLLYTLFARQNKQPGALLEVLPPERFSLGHCSFRAAQSGAVVLPRSAPARRLRIMQNQLETRLQVFMMFTSRSPQESTDVGVDNISNVAGVGVKGSSATARAAGLVPSGLAQASLIYDVTSFR